MLEEIGHENSVKGVQDVNAEVTHPYIETHPSIEDASDAKAIFEAQDAPPMAILLLRLQEIQSFLFLIESERADSLSAALFRLSDGIERSFEQHLYTPYAELSIEQQQAYSGVLQVIATWQMLVEKAEQATPSSARVVGV